MLTKERRQLWIILTIVFLGFLGISMPYLIFPALFLNPEYAILPINCSEGVRALFLGATLAVYPIGQFIGSPILGSLSDDFGRKKLLWGSLLISAIANLCTGIAIAKGALGMLIISRFVAGFMEGNIAIARAMASELTSISKQEAFGKINASSSIAYLIGPLIGGLMTDKSIWEYLTTSTPFYFICIFFICLAALAAFMLKETPKNHIKEILSIYQRINIFKRMNILFRNKKLQFLMITSTAFTLGVDIFYEFGPVYLTVKWLLGPSDLALYNSVLCLALAIGNGMLPAFFSKHFPKKTIICSTLSSLTLILTIVALTNSPLLMVTLFGLSGLAIGLTATLITVKISNSVSDFIHNMCDGFVELHGDRLYGDDGAIIGGIGYINGKKCVIIGQEKGKDTESRLKRNFGMPHPEGYRKALRLMLLAEKFELPIVTFIDTAGAFPGLAAEERGQGSAIATNLMAMAQIKVPIICIIIGEGCSGGALGIGVGDVIAMLQHSYYSVISPEGCASILWKDAKMNAHAAEVLKIHAEDLIKFGIIDEIIVEPVGGAHTDPAFIYQSVKEFISLQLEILSDYSTYELLENRYHKFRKMGQYDTVLS